MVRTAGVATSRSQPAKTVLVTLALCLTPLELPGASAQERSGPTPPDATPVTPAVDLDRTQHLVVTPPETEALSAEFSATREVELATGGRQVARLHDGSIVVEMERTLTLAEMSALGDALVAAGLAAAAEPDPVTTIVRVPNDPFWSQQWGQIETAMPSAWDVTIGDGHAPTVGVLDTGVNDTSEISGRVLSGYNAQTGSSDIADGHGHGTQSATVIAASGDDAAGFAGQCWGCRILPVKVLSDAGNGTMSQLASGMRWAVDNGAELINVSAGGANGSTA